MTSSMKRLAYCSTCLAVHVRPVGNRCSRVLASIARRRSSRQTTRVTSAASQAAPTANSQPTATSRPSRAQRGRPRATSVPDTIQTIPIPIPTATNQPLPTLAVFQGNPGPQGRPVPPGGSSGAPEAAGGQNVMTPTEQLLQTMLSRLGETVDELKALKSQVAIMDQERRAEREQWMETDDSHNCFTPAPNHSARPTEQDATANFGLQSHATNNMAPTAGSFQQHFASQPDQFSLPPPLQQQFPTHAPQSSHQFNIPHAPQSSHQFNIPPSLQQSSFTPPQHHNASHDLADSVADRLSQIRVTQQAGRQRHATAPSASYAGMNATAMSLPGGGSTSSSQFTWPQEHVFRNGEEDIKFNDLSMAELSYGFTASANAERPEVQAFMFPFYERLMEDAASHEWSICRNFCHIVLSKIKSGNLDWTNLTKIEQLRASHLYGASAAASNKESSRQNNNYSRNEQSARNGGGGLNLCHRFNDGNCSSNGSHRVNGRLFQHSCTFCYGRFNRIFNHAEADCNNKSKIGSQSQSAKNEGQGLGQQQDQ